MNLQDRRHSMPRGNQNPTKEYTLRKMYQYYHGPIYKMFSRLPSYKTKLSPAQIERYKRIMDSMTDRELDGLNPEHMSVARMKEIARGSRQDVKQVTEMLKEYKRLEKVWRNLEIYMSDTMLMDMSALFWNEIATPFHVEMVTEPKYVPRRLPPRKKQLPPTKFKLMALVKWAAFIFGVFFIWFFVAIKLRIIS